MKLWQTLILGICGTVLLAVVAGMLGFNLHRSIDVCMALGMGSAFLLSYVRDQRKGRTRRRR